MIRVRKSVACTSAVCAASQSRAASAVRCSSRHWSQSLAVAIFFHERAEERVIHQPRCSRLRRKHQSLPRSRVVLGSRRKNSRRLFQERRFSDGGRGRASPRLCAVSRDRICAMTSSKSSCDRSSRRSGREVQRRRLERDGADRVVGAVIAAHFVDRQELDDLEPDLRRPIDELPQRLQIADAQIGFRAQARKAAPALPRFSARARDSWTGFQPRMNTDETRI